MIALSFPDYTFRFKNNQNKTLIFDGIRKKFVVLTPEEWVRQHVLCYLIQDKGYPKSIINVEKQIDINGLKKRYDIVIFNTDGSIKLLVECKSPSVKITQGVFDQIARYNLGLNADFLMVTNGMEHYYCQVSNTGEKYLFLKDIPQFRR
ncbi:type I restriction enzyme HsdR N-terminal domain-containing protein [Maribacter sp. 2304DJ31-5]|uniref:type I restriction enzyme HsdR N-terminal domain-containing protein n=1 Tax=Maribacter sp. 2304DJ31-5 TaxID=3386273 RepID=UPI0039BCD0A3